jgi:hypothetical protein
MGREGIGNVNTENATGGDAAATMYASVRDVLDRVAIWELACRYAIALDDYDVGALEHMFVADVEFEGIDGQLSTGTTDVLAYLMRAPGPHRQRVHTPTSLIIGELSHGRGSGIVSSFAAHTGGGQPLTFLSLRYEDNYVHEGGQWCFARRRVHGVVRLTDS